MGKFDKILIKVLSGTNDANIKFKDMCYLLDKLGFESRVKGSHHIYYKTDVAEILNIQEKNSLSKPYQVKQVRNLIQKYKLGNLNV